MVEPPGDTIATGAGSPAVLRRTLHTSREAGDVCHEVVAQLRQAGYNERDCFAVHLACEEALANALRHGNRNDPTKEVRLLSTVTPETVRIEIEDEGEGFSPEDLPDPTAPQNLESESGRGVLLMRAYMQVEFQGKGNRVVLSRRH